MKLLFDQNLSRHLVTRLGMEYPESSHVTDVGLDTASDEEIWAYAGERDFVIVSKDSDFRQLAFLHGPPPKAVWLRAGNITTNDVHQLLADGYDALTDFVAAVDEALLILEPTQPRSKARSQTAHSSGQGRADPAVPSTVPVAPTGRAAPKSVPWAILCVVSSSRFGSDSLPRSVWRALAGVIAVTAVGMLAAVVVGGLDGVGGNGAGGFGAGDTSNGGDATDPAAGHVGDTTDGSDRGA